MSDVDGYLKRTFMSPTFVGARTFICDWMEDASLRTLAFYLLSNPNQGCQNSWLMVMLISKWVDSMGNWHGRVKGMNASAQALLIGLLGP